MKNSTLLVLIIFFGIVYASADEALFKTTVVFPIEPDNRPNYRIPALIEATNGDLLIFAEKRNDGIGDIGDHDIVMKRSRDLGETWGEVEILLDDNLANTDLTLAVDPDSGRIWLFFLRDKKEFCYFTSDDHGSSWQGPVSIHKQVIRRKWEAYTAPVSKASPGSRKAEWEKGWMQRYGVGPGHGAVFLKSGRLVVPVRHNEDIGGGRMRTFSHCFYTDDGGKSWQLGGTIGIYTNECQLVELNDGRLMVNARNQNPGNFPDNYRRLVAISENGGESWEPLLRAEQVISPRCHGSIERYDKETLLFSNPANPLRQSEHPYGRYNLTVRFSKDEGRSWSAGRTIWPHPSAYSDLATLRDGTIGIVYERADKGSTHYWDEIHFARFELEWLRPRLSFENPTRSSSQKGGR